ncbi:hypothetical protein PhCBS80983_g00153 [Powellomyces hirtus]|uniref:Pentacotripeptide-repeat region of PRORP domain-containing protein n=1 Tax=Powellomyces hirtus TaxID=109895 RepID=A0A507EGU4_9FUNG|nr:hypothetical protein PhCBS80983_g00153 [Powellomyces hirtus]
MSSHKPIKQSQAFICRRCTIARHAAAAPRRTFFSFSSFLPPKKVQSSKSPQRAIAEPNGASLGTSRTPPTESHSLGPKREPFSKLSNADEQELYDDLTERFLERLRSTDGNSHDAWEDYSKLVANTLENVNLSSVAHHRLFKMLQNTPAHAGEESKAVAMSTIVHNLASSARMVEYERLMELYDKQNDPAKIHALIAEMRRNGKQPTLQAYNHLIAVYVRNNDMSAATNTYEKLRNSDVWGIGPKDTLQPNVTTYSLLIRGHLNNQHYGLADHLFSEMRAFGFVPSVSIYNGLMLGLVRRGRNAAAIRLFNDMKSSETVQPNLPSYRLCMAAYANSHKNDAVRKLLDDMLTAASTLVPRPDYAIWKMAIRAYVMAGDLTGALALFARMKDAASLHERGAEGHLGGVVKPGADIFDTLIDLCCKKGDLGLAQELFAEAFSAGMTVQSSTWNELISKLSTTSNWGAALGIFQQSKTKPAVLRADTLAIFAHACLAANELDMAISVVRAAVSTRPSSPAVIGIMEELMEAILAADRIPDALSFLDFVRKYALHINADPLSRLYLPILKAYVKGNKGWDAIVGLYDDFTRIHGHSSTLLANELIRTACVVPSNPVSAIVALIESGINPSVAGWVDVVDAFLDARQVAHLRELDEALSDCTEQTARVGHVILDMVLDRLERPAAAESVQAAHLSMPDRTTSVWAGFAQQDAEQILALIARRSSLST